MCRDYAALCDSFSSLDHVAAVYTVVRKGKVVFISFRPYVDPMMLTRWGLKDEEEIYEEVNAKHKS